MKKILLIAAVLIVLIVAYVGVTTVFRPQAANCCHGEQYLPPTNPALKDWTTYTDNDFGFTLAYPNTLKVTKKDDTITIGTGNEQGYAPFSVIEFATTTVEDSTGKWGVYKIRFDSATNGWVATHANERDGSPYDVPVQPLMTTYGGFPVFEGGIRFHGYGIYSYIVAMSHDKFLLVTGTETVSSQTPEKEPVYTLVKSIISTHN